MNDTGLWQTLISQQYINDNYPHSSYHNEQPTRTLWLLAVTNQQWPTTSGGARGTSPARATASVASLKTPAAGGDTKPPDAVNQRFIDGELIELITDQSMVNPLLVTGSVYYSWLVIVNDDEWLD